MGHGAFNGSSHIIVNKDSESHLFNLEDRLRAIGRIPNTFVMGHFNCQRTIIDAFDPIDFWVLPPDAEFAQGRKLSL